MSTEHGFAAYPPTVERMKILGYMVDESGIFFSRDIGRSFELGGKIFLVFGDTFCKDEAGKFIGLVNNTCAAFDDRNEPLKTRYIEYDENRVLKPFIPFLEAERRYNRPGRRVVIWAFGGAVEVEDGTGRVWYQKSVDNGGGDLTYIGTGMAKIVASIAYNRQPIVQRILVEPERDHDTVFAHDEPRMGTFSAIAHGDHIYLFGDRPDGKIILARVSSLDLDRDLAQRQSYRFWNGADWVPEWESAAVVIEGMQQGAIVRSKLFGDDRPFLFVGTSKGADSQVYMGASATLEGPWEMNPVCKAEGINEQTSKGKWMYCIYPQLWASDEEKAELMLTWSEQCPGGVVAAKIKLAGFPDMGVEI